MAAPVQVVVGALGEGLAAQFTTIGPFPGVETPMLEEVGASREGLATVPADIGALPGVRPLVLGERRALVEAAAAVIATVRLLSRMDDLVLGQIRAAAKTLPTHATGVWVQRGRLQEWRRKHGGGLWKKKKGHTCLDLGLKWVLRKVQLICAASFPQWHFCQALQLTEFLQAGASAEKGQKRIKMAPAKAQSTFYR